MVPHLMELLALVLFHDAPLYLKCEIKQNRNFKDTEEELAKLSLRLPLGLR